MSSETACRSSQAKDEELDLLKDSAVVLVMGHTGAGKTTFIKALTGRDDIEVGLKLSSGTTEVKLYDSTSTLSGRRVVLVDTPGTGATDMDDTEVFRRVGGWLGAIFKQGLMPTGVVFLTRIDVWPGTVDYRQELAVLRQVCGESFLGNVVLVTTAGVPGGSAREQSWIDDLKSDQRYWKPFVHYGANVVTFDGERECAARVLSSLEGRGAKPLLIQTELGNMSLEESTAWSIVRKGGYEDGGDLAKGKKQLLVHLIRLVRERLARPGQRVANPELACTVASVTAYPIAADQLDDSGSPCIAPIVPGDQANAWRSTSSLFRMRSVSQKARSRSRAKGSSKENRGKESRGCTKDIQDGDASPPLPIRPRCASTGSPAQHDVVFEPAPSHFNRPTFASALDLAVNGDSMRVVTRGRAVRPRPTSGVFCWVNNLWIESVDE